MNRWRARSATDPSVLGAVAVLVIAVIAACWPTFAQLAGTWAGDVTYQYGWFVPAATVYLVWRERDRLSGLAPRPSWAAIGVLAVILLLWAAAYVIDVRVVAQFAAVGAMIAAIVAVLGGRAAREIAFPLGFLLLAVPVGEGLIPVLMDFTAAFTVHALQWSGVPVYRSGYYFVIPSGLFEVAKSCSGIRYVMAAVTLSALLGYFMYRSWRRRLALIAVAVIIAVLANGVRAYVIVLIAHLSDMRLAVGVDHFIYGWGMFIVVVLAMYAVGSLLRERENTTGSAAEPLAARDCDTAARPEEHTRRLPIVVLAGLVVLAGACLMSRGGAAVTATMQVAQAFEAQLPVALAGWSGPNSSSVDWQPHYPGAAVVQSASYNNGNQRVSVFIAGYPASAPASAEMVSGQHGVRAGREATAASAHLREVRFGSGAFTVMQARLAGPDMHSVRAVWFWYEVGEEHATSAATVKALEVKNLLRRRNSPERVYVLSSLSGGDSGRAAEQALADFLAAHGEALTACARDPRAAAGLCAAGP